MNILARIILPNHLKSMCQRSIYISTVYQSETLINNKNSKYEKIGFFGAGNMAKAIIQGLITKKKFSPEQIYATDKNIEYLEYLKNKDPFFQVTIYGFNKFISYIYTYFGFKRNTELISLMKTIFLTKQML